MPCCDLGNPELDLALGVFLSIVGETLGDALRSVILYGSVALRDLAPGYGDLDFVAITDDDIADDRREALIEARRPLRSGTSGDCARMIEGAFLPRHMICPGSTGRAVWWGTSGERLWESNWLGWFDCLGIRERGVVIHGEDLRREFPVPTREQLVVEGTRFIVTARKYGRGGELHSVDWLLTAARMLYWLKEGELASKSQAADWAYTNATGDWRAELPKAAWLRRNPDNAETGEVVVWLCTLDVSIQEACCELEAQLPTARSTDSCLPLE